MKGLFGGSGLDLSLVASKGRRRHELVRMNILLVK